MSKQWHNFVVNDVKQTLSDNKGYSNMNRDAHEKRLIAAERGMKAYLRENSQENLEANYRGTSIQKDKSTACVFQQGFFGKSAQGTFKVDDEKPYVHQFRDYSSNPIFYN